MSFCLSVFHCGDNSRTEADNVHFNSVYRKQISGERQVYVYIYCMYECLYDGRSYRLRALGRYAFRRLSSSSNCCCCWGAITCRPKRSAATSAQTKVRSGQQRAQRLYLFLTVGVIRLCCCLLCDPDLLAASSFGCRHDRAVRAATSNLNTHIPHCRSFSRIERNRYIDL